MDELSERARRAAAREAGLKTAGLYIALDRMGGRLTFTEAEFQKAMKRVGGAHLATIQVAVVRSADGEAVELTLVPTVRRHGELAS
jgi:hypothetical protein